LKKLSKIKIGDKTPIKTWSRDSIITPGMVGLFLLCIMVKIFIEVEAREEMVGHHLGEFSITRKFFKHGGKMQKELETKAKTIGKTPNPVKNKKNLE